MWLIVGEIVKSYQIIGVCVAALMSLLTMVKFDGVVNGESVVAVLTGVALTT